MTAIGLRFMLGLFVACGVSQGAFASGEVFRLHLFSEPTQFLAHQQKNSNGSYAFSQLYWGLLQYQDGELKPGLARKCLWKKPNVVRCELQKNLKFSNGQPILPSDFLRALQKVLDPKSPARRADLFFAVKNAREVLNGSLPFEKLGVKVDAASIEFTLIGKSPEFLYNLTSNYLSPLPDLSDPKVSELEKWPTTGPYKFKSYVASDRLVIEPNPYFFDGKKERPTVEFLFVADDTVALNMYRAGRIDFDRRLPTMNIPEFENKSDFHAVPLLRFDYFGLRSYLSKEQRQALASSLNYEELQKLFHAKPRPGCPGIPEAWMGKKICHDFKPPSLESSNGLNFPTSNLLVTSRLGGDDHRRVMEWVQDQWKRNLNFRLELDQIENQIFTSRLEKDGPLIFRKGISLDRPTCLAAIETFHSQSNENYLKIKSKSLDSVIDQLVLEKNEKKRQQLCSQAVSELMNDAWIIPTGPIYFSILVQPHWQGWRLNELNELDLSQLHFVQKK